MGRVRIACDARVLPLRARTEAPVERILRIVETVPAKFGRRDGGVVSTGGACKSEALQHAIRGHQRPSDVPPLFLALLAHLNVALK